MKKYSIIIFLLAYQYICSASTGDNSKDTVNHDQPVYLNGSIDEKPFSDSEIELTVYHKYFFGHKSLGADTYEFSSIPSNNDMHLNNVENFTYIGLSGLNRLSAVKGDWIFLMPGDSLFLEVQDNEIYAKGRGANRVNCLWEINKMNWDFFNKIDSSSIRNALVKESRQKTNATDDEKLRTFFYEQQIVAFKKADYLYDLKEAVLESYKGQLSQKEFDFIACENLAWKDMTYLKLWIDIPNYTEPQKQVREQLFKDIILKIPIREDSPELMVESKVYADFLAQKERLYFLSEKTSEDPNFIEIEKSIRNKYHGKLYERVLTSLITLSNLNGYGIRLTAEDLLTAQKSVKEKSYANIIEGYRLNLNGSLNIRSYDLFDTLGKKVDWNTFDGKVMVVDFWFSGCVNCMILTQAMKPVVTSYSSNPDVIFLSINLDKVKSMWLNSLKSDKKRSFDIIEGSYTHPESINLSTCPDGFSHPLVKKLNIFGAPQLLIVDKMGYLVERNPPLPNNRDASSCDDIKRIIQKYLDNPT